MSPNVNELNPGPKGGLIGPKNLGDFWVFPLIFNGILMPKWGFNYSKIAKT